MGIRGVIARVRVSDLDGAVRFYEALTGASAKRFGFGGVALASVVPFLLFAASGEDGDRVANVVAPLMTDDLDSQLADLEALGASVVAAASSTPNGGRTIVRHPDGAVFEYVAR